MTLALDLPSCRASMLGQRDPRWKLLAVGVMLVGVCALQTAEAAAAACVGALLLVWLGRLPPLWLARRLGATALVLLVFVAFLPFVVRGPGAVWDFAGWRVSEAGLRAAGLVFFKAIALVTLSLVLLATTPLPVLGQAAHALRVPGLLVQLVMLTHRYVFVLADELRRLRIALRARGYRNRMSRHSYRTLGHVTGTLFVRGQQRAERVGHAMRCRGFDGRYRTLAEFHTRPADVLLAVLVLAGVGGLVLGDYFLT